MRERRAPYLATGVATGVLLPFVAPILASRGFTPKEIGLLLAITFLAIVAAGSISGHVGDVLLGRRRTLQSAALLSAIAALVLGEPLALPLERQGAREAHVPLGQLFRTGREDQGIRAQRADLGSPIVSIGVREPWP